MTPFATANIREVLLPAIVAGGTKLWCNITVSGSPRFYRSKQEAIVAAPNPKNYLTIARKVVVKD